MIAAAATTSRPSVLIVEDERLVAMDIARRIKAMGFKVAGTTATGEEAVAMAASLRPSIVLMDIMLAGAIDGVEAARRIMQDVGLPVIYLTAYADEGTLARARITGPFGYVIKPFEPRELHLTIEMALYKHRLEKKLLENRRWLATTLKSIGDAVLTTDPAGLVRFLNPAAESLLGLGEDEARGRHLAEIFQVLDEETGAPAEHPAHALLRGERPPDECSDMLLVTRSGDMVPIASSVAPMTNDSGEFLGAVLVFRNISHKKLHEEHLKDSVLQLRQTLDETVEALALMSEKRDLYTAGHQKRVADLACAVARELSLDEERISGLHVASILHDIGKIYVPAEILTKPSLLTSMEMGIMKTHSEVGFDILRNISFPWPVAQIVRQHHERLDGSGYPDGLCGDAIMPEARILAVADVVEAMSSHRPYRAALGVRRALEEIEACRGRRYDSDAVDACLSLFREKAFAFDDKNS